MKDSRLQNIAVFTAVVLQIFILGTVIYFALETFGFYSINEAGEKEIILNVDFWPAVAASAIIIIPLRVIAEMGRIAKREMLEDLMSSMDDIDWDGPFTDKTPYDKLPEEWKKPGSRDWDPPKAP